MAAVASAVASPTAASDTDWQSSVTRAIADGEYHLSLSDATGAFTAPNRAHDFRTRWSADGAFTLESRTEAKAWSLSYRLLGVGRGDARTLPGVRHENVSDGRIEWERDGLREWYVNDARGIEQGFVLASRPGGDGRRPVIIDGAIDGLLAYPSDDGKSVLFRTTGGRDAMRMHELSVVDAAGRALASCFEIGEDAFAILIDDRDVVYPLTLRFLLTSPTWTGESNQMNAHFGSSVATAGDVNGDGYSDIIVGANNYDNGELAEGRAFLFLGAPSGLSTSAAWTVEGNQINAFLGNAVATAGDVNADGYSDVAVAAYDYDVSDLNEGRVYVYLGSPAGLAATADWIADGTLRQSRFGSSVASAGDVNGDGYADLLVGAQEHGSLGRALVYLGSASGLAMTAAWIADGSQLYSFFGSTVATAGDVNGDGFSDVIVGAPNFDNFQIAEGRAYAYLGSSTGLGATASWNADGILPGAFFGNSAATAGDVNGDGYADVIVGAYGYANGESNEGRAFVYLGSASGLAANAAWTDESDQADAQFGIAVASAGDVNGDGYADVIVGARFQDNGESNEGVASLYLGSPSGVSDGAAWTVEGNQATAAFGAQVATAGDVNGDGYSDVIIAAYWYDDGETDEGRAFVYHGSASGLAAAESWSAESDRVNSFFGTSVATAGDVNGDAYSDVIVGANWYDNGEMNEGRVFVYHGSAAGLAASPSWTAESNLADASFGQSVATAGDVNGDGYADVIVGAPHYDNGEIGEGRAIAYYGAASGLMAVPAWTAESNQIGAQFGISVATAGDVDGDGYSDVIVGADSYGNGETNEGRAFVYPGSASGLGNTAAWTAEGNQMDAQFGLSVASAGDVNGDGYSDVIVGAHRFDNGVSDEGRASVYLGSSSGLAAAESWTAEGNQRFGLFGQTVATAGDVNGDGFSDVIVGAPLHSNGETGEGLAFAFYGSVSGLATVPAWTTESDQTGAYFGGSVATAGDVNGDGFSDVIVGAERYQNGEVGEGRAFVYHGSASGLSTTFGWSAEGNHGDAWFGYPVATAGDVNGDGYSDVIVGARRYDNGESDEGRAFLYYGNDGDGLDSIPRQARADGAAPIDLLGGTLSTDGFRLRANGRSPFGRDRVRLEWEVKPVATPFDGADIRTSNWFDTGAPGASGSVVPLDELHTPLAGPGPFHWRLRLRSRSPFPWQSHWMSLPYNAITETDLRTENNLARCDLAYADLTFPPLTPAKVAPWVYGQTCAGGDVLPTLLLPSIVSGSDVDTLGGSPGTLRFYQLSCGCADGMWLTKRAGMVRLEMF